MIAAITAGNNNLSVTVAITTLLIPAVTTQVWVTEHVNAW